MVTWDDTTEKRFLLTMLQALNPDKLPWAEILQSMGREYSMESLKQRYKKIKLAAKGEPGTPAGKKGQTKVTKSGGKRRKGNEIEQSGEEEQVEKTPSKKTKVKEESGGDDEGELV